MDQPSGTWEKTTPAAQHRKADLNIQIRCQRGSRRALVSQYQQKMADRAHQPHSALSGSDTQTQGSARLAISVPTQPV